MSYVEIGKNEGAKITDRGSSTGQRRHAKGWFYAPTVFGDCSPRMCIAQEKSLDRLCL